MVSRKLEYVSLVLALLLSLAVRWPFLRLPLTVDEGTYAYVTWWWLRGETLYQRIWIDRPQGLFVLFAAVFRLGGESPEALRFGVALLNLGTTALVYGMARRFAGGRTAVAAAVCYAVLSAHPRIEGVIANSEILEALPATLSLWLLLAGLERRGRAVWLLGAGLAAGGAVLIKQSGVAALLLDLTVLALAWWRPRDDASRNRRELATATASLLAGFLILLGVSVAQGAATAPNGYWEALAGHRLAYGSVVSYPLQQQAVAWLANFLEVWPAVTPFALAAAWGLIWGPRPPVVWLWLLWSGWALTLGGEWWGHYYLQLAPPLSVLAALGISSAAAYPWGRFAGLALAGVALMGGLAFGGDWASFMAAPGTPAQAARYSRETRYLWGADIAAYLREQVPPDRGVYVAYEGAEINYQAQRFSPVRYLFRTDLFAVPGAYDELLAALADPQRRPAAVVARSDALTGPGGAGDQRLEALLAQAYRPAHRFGPWEVYLEDAAAEPGAVPAPP